MGCKTSKIAESIGEENEIRKEKSRKPKHRRRHRKHKHRHGHHHSRRPEVESVEFDKVSHDDSNTSQHEITIEVPQNEDTVSEESAIVDEFVDIVVADPEAFNPAFVQQRKQAIKNTSYRSVIESWNPNSLQQLAETIKAFSNGKNLVDRHWIIFYWITFNIEYDTVSYFSKNYEDQSAEGVFRTRKGVCAGYANIYKYLCDHIEIPCEIVSGYSKGYGFDDREGAPTETDHAWNAVEIYHHWYLMESTWGAGHLNDNKQFKRELTPYYFLARPNEMIYHHLPEDNKWQLLQKPIKMGQYMQMPHLRHDYFEFNLEIIQPQNQDFINLEPDKPFALVIMKAPANVYLMADLKIHDKKVEGGHRVIFDRRKRLFYCYFAPSNIGKHKTTIYAKRGDGDVGSYTAILDLKLNIKQMPADPISYPKTWKCFYDYGLKILSPLRTHLINLDNGGKFTQIIIRTPSDIELMGKLENHQEEKILCGDQVYYDKEKDYWRCKFAPNENGMFDALILAKKKTDPGSYTAAVSFKINANQIPTPPYSFPKTWQNFYDLNLKILSPVGRGIIALQDKTPFVQIHIKTPKDVSLVSQFRTDQDEEVPNGQQIFYEAEKDFWRCKFAPNRTGMFDAIILAKKTADPGSYTSAVSFKVDVKQLATKSASLLDTTQVFHDLKLKVVFPVDRSKIILSEKSSSAEICLKTPNDVMLLGQLTDTNKKKIPDGVQVYYDRHKDIWRCKFAPNYNGLFNAMIFAKKKSDSNSYSLAVTFQIEAKHIPTPPLTFPDTSQTFYDFDLKIEAPRSRSTAVWSENASYAEILIRAPDDITLSGRIEYKNSEIENGSLVQYDHEKKLWQLLFAPQRTGLHELLIFAKQINDEASAKIVVTFSLNVTKLKRPIRFPTVYSKFESSKCRIYTPLDGILKKDSIIPIHCVIPGATSVTLTIDSKSARVEGYEDPILQRQITVGSEEVTIYGKYGQSPHYTALIKYSVE